MVTRRQAPTALNNSTTPPTDYNGVVGALSRAENQSIDRIVHGTLGDTNDANLRILRQAYAAMARPARRLTPESPEEPQVEQYVDVELAHSSSAMFDRMLSALAKASRRR